MLLPCWLAGSHEELVVVQLYTLYNCLVQEFKYMCGSWKAMQAVHLRILHFFGGLCIKYSQPFLHDVTQALLIDLQSTGRFFESVFIKHRLMAFPVTKSFSGHKTREGNCQDFFFRVFQKNIFTFQRHSFSWLCTNK